MNRLTWILLNAVLLIAAWGVTAWVRDYEPGASLAAVTGEVKTREHPNRSSARQFDMAAPLGHHLQAEDFDELWTRTLFRPERTEEVATGEDGEAEEKAPVKANLELVGVGKIGSKPVAIILEKSMARRSLRRRFGSLRHTGSRLSGGHAKKDDTPTKTKHIYREGETVGKTGYVVSKIDFTEVLLVRGGEELTLKIEAGDDQSESRREKAVASAKARSTARKAEQAKHAKARPATRGRTGAPPPPPPPPVAAPAMPPGGKKSRSKFPPGKTRGSKTTTSSPAAMSREERLRRAKLLRERILQQRQKEIEGRK